MSMRSHHGNDILHCFCIVTGQHGEQNEGNMCWGMSNQYSASMAKSENIETEIWHTTF